MATDNHLAQLLNITEATVMRDGVCLVDRLNVSISQGQHTAILGPNGSGKSTLIKLITRQLYPLTSRDGRPVITIFGNELWDVFTLRSQMGIVSADFHQALAYHPDLLGWEVVVSGFFAGIGLARGQVITPEMHERAAAALDLMEARQLTGKPLAVMSTGEARRVLIARALAPNPKALILDEPTAGLDLVSARHFLTTLRHIGQRNATVILVTHHIDEILPEIERVILLKNGKVFRDGSKDDILTDATMSELYDTQISVRKNEGYYRAELTSATR